jgi:hypothetical protein
MKDNLLELEIRLLVLKYGADKIKQALAINQSMTVDELDREIRQLEQQKRLRKPISKWTAEEFVRNLKMDDPEKTVALTEVAKNFDNRTFLPQLRDVKVLLGRFNIDVGPMKSRGAAVKPVFDRLSQLPIADLRRITEDAQGSKDSVFSDLVGEIIGSRGKKETPSS